jgi:hypothetical protein
MHKCSSVEVSRKPWTHLPGRWIVQDSKGISWDIYAFPHRGSVSPLPRDIVRKVSQVLYQNGRPLFIGKLRARVPALELDDSRFFEVCFRYGVLAKQDDFISYVPWNKQVHTSKSFLAEDKVQQDLFRSTQTTWRGHADKVIVTSTCDRFCAFAKERNGRLHFWKIEHCQGAALWYVGLTDRDGLYSKAMYSSNGTNIR